VRAASSAFTESGELREFKSRLDELNRQLEASASKQDYEEAARLRSEVLKVKADYDEKKAEWEKTSGYSADKELVAEFEKRAGDFAAKCVAEVGDAAKAAGVPFEGVVVKSQSPHKAIIDAAKQHKCDAIFIASHGHKGLTGLVLGSVTQKVLVNTEIPVLVFR